jgi:hypothetical protein
MLVMDSHGILTRIISPSPLPFNRPMKAVYSNMPQIPGKMAKILRRAIAVLDGVSNRVKSLALEPGIYSYSKAAIRFTV